MSKDKFLKELQNSGGKSKEITWGQLAKKYNFATEDAARGVWRRFQEKGVRPIPGAERKVNIEKGILDSTITLDFEPKDHIALAKAHKVDLTKYYIAGYWSKQLDSGKFTSSVRAQIIDLDTDLIRQKELLLEELKGEMEWFETAPRLSNTNKLAYEINIPDIHFGKLAWAAESGEDYDIEIAENRYQEAVQGLLEYVDSAKLGKIIFPIGNDMINIDSRKNETFAGTKQDSDSRFFKIVQVVKRILIKTINSLSLIAPVDVIVISGNHDPESMFMIGEILDAYYHSNKDVTIDNSPKQRKYAKFGITGFQYTHGNEENHKDLGLIFATEQPKLWAETKQRICKVGHFHKSKKLSYVSVDEFQGFRVQILPSLSGSDAWHSSKGYNSLKQAKGFLYDKDKGEVAELTYSINTDFSNKVIQ